jgi:hypothetical protein
VGTPFSTWLATPSANPSFGHAFRAEITLKIGSRRPESRFVQPVFWGAIPPRFQRGDQLMNRSPDRGDVVGASLFSRAVADVRAVRDHDRDLRCA